ncbi:MAG: patatin-like phospholipase family protein [Candidatus Poribacteria bacterium]|nr:patatin-like phospholipase family protein [Candidatus Poribacteria bacterium]
MTKDDLKIGIALSGGGVRAAVFHLGILGRLAEDSLLEKVKYLSTVSGGTLVTGLIYSIAENRWPASDFFLRECLIQARRYLTQTNIQLGAILRVITQPRLLLGKRLKSISKSIQKSWKISESLNDIPPEPRWILNATTYESGRNWQFIPQGWMGEDVTNYVEKPSIPLTDAMAASAAYPILIGPLVLDTKNFRWFQFQEQRREESQAQFRKLHLWDGGVYDNLGLEGLYDIENQEYKGDYDFLVISDASDPIEIEQHSRWFWKRMDRVLAVMIDQARILRSRILMNHFESHGNSGVYFEIGNTAREILETIETDEGLDEELIDELTRNTLSMKQAKDAEDFKTTLWRLEEAEYDLLYRHGWETANFTLQARCPDIFQHMEWNG